MSSYINNFALSPGSRRTGVRAYDHRIPTSTDSYEAPAFYEPPSIHATPVQTTSSPLNPPSYLADRRQEELYNIPESDSYEVPAFYHTPSRHATPYYQVQTTPSPLNPPWYLAARRHAGLYSIPDSDSYEVPVFYRSPSRHAISDERTSNALNPPRFLEDRMHGGPYSIPDFPAQPYVLNGDTGRGFNPRLRETHQQSAPPPRSTRQTNTRAPTPVENPRSRALKKLKKEIYDPIPTTKLLAKKVSFYYRNKGANALKEMENKEKEKNEDGKRCAVCLEDFVPNQEVMVTPCKHMFHEDCIVPWLESQGQCPLCRFVIWEKARDNPSSLNNNDVGRMAPSNLIAGELLSILRAMEEAFQLGPDTDL